MDDLFDKALHYLGRNKKDTFVINIGAMDGVMFDEMVGYTNMYGFKGLYVEPIPYLFEQLPINFPQEGNRFENSAISNQDGKIDMLTIDRDAIDKNEVHSCFYGMSSIYPPKNGLASEGDAETVRKHGKIVSVDCITFDTLIQRHNLTDIDVLKIDTEGHDFVIFNQIDLKKHNIGVIRVEWINLSENERTLIEAKLNFNGYRYEVIGQDITAITPELYDKIFTKEVEKEKEKVTVVTGLWDISRNNLSEGWGRNFDHYKTHFKNLLAIENPMIIFCEEQLEGFIWEHRTKDNTILITRAASSFKENFDFYQQVQDIRQDETWLSRSGWIRESTQARLPLYNPLVMSKIFMLNDARIFDTFDSDMLIWVDAGITNTVHQGYFTHDKVLRKLPNIVDNFFFISFPYDGKVEIHGFEYEAMCKYAGAQVDCVARGGIFGGKKKYIERLNQLYYDILRDSINSGYMGTEESLFTILMYRHPDLIQYFDIEDNGLISKFCEDAKENRLEPKKKFKKVSAARVALYVLTYNSPKQLSSLLTSLNKCDEDFINKPNLIVIDNSTDEKTFQDYEYICKEYNAIRYKFNNIGINGGRFFAAKHAYENNYDFHLFFEDDMNLLSPNNDRDRFGLSRWFPNLYRGVVDIMQRYDYDFLKLSFQEFFGDNSEQWAWTNLPEIEKRRYFPNMPIDGVRPQTQFKEIKLFSGLPFIDGEVYYSNWPQIVSKNGCYKMFLETQWEYPYEQTWMSHIYQEMKKGNIRSAIILGSPVEHDRFQFYPKEDRREN